MDFSDSPAETAFRQELREWLGANLPAHRRDVAKEVIRIPEALRHLAAEVGPGQIVMGTDYPFPWTRTSVDHILGTPGLSDAEKIAMLGGTAMALLGISG